MGQGEGAWRGHGREWNAGGRGDEETATLPKATDEQAGDVTQDEASSALG